MKGRKERGERERREVGKGCKQRREVMKSAVGGNRVAHQAASDTPITTLLMW